MSALWAGLRRTDRDVRLLQLEGLLSPARWATILVIGAGLVFYHGPNRDLIWALVLLACGYNLIVTRLLLRSKTLVTSRWLDPLLHGALSVAGLLITGGLDSPFHPLLTVQLSVIALRSSFRQALTMCTSLTLAFLAGCWVLSPQAHPERLLVFAAFNLIAVWMVTSLVRLAKEQQAEFLRVAAHELRNPMTAVRGASRLISEQASRAEHGAGLAPTLSILEREVDHLSQLLTEITEASAAYHQSYRLNPTSLDLRQFVGSSLRQFAETEIKHQYIFGGDCCGKDSPIWVRGDASRLRGLLSNLLSNAAKYSPEGTAVRVSVEERNGLALVSVVDQGIGIPQDQVQKVFDPFYRADNLGRNDPGGMGLGLYICQDIVHRHHGRIWADSGDGAGTSISFELPLDMTKPGIPASRLSSATACNKAVEG